MATGGASLQQQQEAAALFEAKHAEFVAEAHGVARDFRATVRAVVFRPAGGGAVLHEFLGGSLDLREVGRIQRAVARDVSAMGVEEVAEHQRQLGNMRALVVRALQVKQAAARAQQAAGAAAAAVGAPGGAKRAPEQQLEEAAAGAGASDSKIRRILIE